MKSFGHAHRIVCRFLAGCSCLCGVTWRGARTHDDRHRARDGGGGPAPSPLRPARICDDGHRASGHRFVRRSFDYAARTLRASFLADGRRRSAHPAASSAHEPFLRSGDASSGLPYDAGFLLLARSAYTHPRNLAAPSAFAARRQRSVLANLLASVDPENSWIIAERLLGEFRTLDRLGLQTPESLERVLGKESRVTHLLLASREVMLESMRGDLQRGKIDPSSRRLIEYLIASMGALPMETLRVLFLDAQRTLIADEQMQRGSVERLTLYPRAIFRRAIELDAAGIILVHNHPSGNPTPSETDELATDILVHIGQSLDIAVLEHIIVTATDHRCMLRDGHRKGSRRASRLDLREASKSQRNERSPHSAERAAALTNARRTLRRRLLLRQLLGSGRLFHEPARDVLLDLFIHECEGKAVSTSSLCIASVCP